MSLVAESNIQIHPITGIFVKFGYDHCRSDVAIYFENRAKMKYLDKMSQ